MGLKNIVTFSGTEEEGLKRMAVFLAELTRQGIVFTCESSNGDYEVELTGF